MLVDVVSTHESCKSYREKAVKNADLRLAKTLSSLTHSASVPDPVSGSSSPTLQTVQKRKEGKYQLLYRLASRQASKKERGVVTFVPFAFTTSGELNAKAGCDKPSNSPGTNPCVANITTCRLDKSISITRLTLASLFKKMS